MSKVKNKNTSKKNIESVPAPDSRQKTVLNYLNIILLVLLGIFVCLITTTKIFIDNDVFWHLATGKYIIENKVIPNSDVFGYITQGVKWIPFEWGWDVLTYLLMQAGGYVMLSVFRSLLFVLIFYYAYRLTVRSGLSFNLFILFSIIFCFGMLIRLGIRPQLISYMLIPLIIYMLLNYKFSGNKVKLLYFLPVIFLVWANMHMGVLLGIAIFFIFLFSEYVLYFINAKSKTKIQNVSSLNNLKKIFFIFIVSAAALLINPFFADTYKYTFMHTQMDMLDSISEWKSPFESGISGFYYVRIYLFFLVAGAMILFYSYRQKNLFTALLYIVFGIYSVNALRYTSDFIIIIFIPFLISANFLLEAFLKNRKGKFLYGDIIFKSILGILLVYMIVNIPDNSLYKGLLNNRFRETGFGVNENFYPSKLMDFVKRERINTIGNRPFNNLRVGGYFIWELPENRNFIDSRNLNNDIMTEYNIIDQHKPGFEDKLKNYNIDYILYSVPNMTENSTEIEKDLIGYAGRSPDWKLVYWDDISLLFVKNEAKFREIIDKFEYKYITPTNFIYNRKVLLSALQNDKEEFMKELRRKVSEDKNGVLTNNIIKSMNLPATGF